MTVKIIQGADPGDEQGPTITDLQPAKPERVFEGWAVFREDWVIPVLFSDGENARHVAIFCGGEASPCLVTLKELARLTPPEES